ncbi:MAG: glycoside hydrolase family 10 protein [Saccharofermentanales bacterium]
MEKKEEGEIQKKEKKDWYKYNRIAMEWIYTKRGLDPEKWVPEMVEFAQSLNIDTLAFDLYHGGYALFNQAVAKKDTHIGDADILALLDREVHKRGMKLYLMQMGSHCANYMATEYPGWRVVNQKGDNVDFYPEYLMCLNTPYANLLLQEFAELLPRYKIDGIYIEGLYGVFGAGLDTQVTTECYCDFCRTEFERMYGFPIPADGVKNSWQVREFRAKVTTDFVRKVRKVINENSPDTVFMPSPSFYSFTDFEEWGKYADVISLERQWGYQRDNVNLYEIGMSMQIMKALSGKPVGGVTFLAWTVDRNYAPCTP